MSDEHQDRIVPTGPPSPRAELAVVLLLLCAAVCSAGFVVAYAVGDLAGRTQYLGLSLGLALAFVAAALIVASKRLVVTEELEEEYPEHRHEDEVAAVDRIVGESGSRITRKRLLGAAVGAAGAALGAALLVPVASLGPLLRSDPLYKAPWRRGRRLVDEHGRPLIAADIEEGDFYTAYPEGMRREQIGAPVVVVRLTPAALHLPAGRAGWAPDGIVAYSKVCTHAGCAVSLYRKPTFAPVQPRPALVCPCHYSTFDPARGADVIFGPAGRPLPQLPLMVDSSGALRAAGNFSGPVGPGWWGVRLEKPQ